MLFLKTYKKSLLTLILCCTLVPSSSSASFWHSWSKKQKTVAVITASALGLTALGYYLYSEYQDLLNRYKQIEIKNLPKNLLEACKQGNLDTIKRLIDKGVDVNKVDIYDENRSCYQTPLYFACYYNHLELAKLLIVHGADVNKTKPYEATLLQFACFYGHLDIAQLFIKHGADVDKADDSFGHTPLHVTCYCDNLNIVKFLIQHGAKTDARDFQGRTPRMMVSYSQTIINYLNQLDASEKDFDYNTQATPELLQRFIACKIHDTYVLKHFSIQDKKVQKELMFHALLHNTNMLMKFYYSDPKCDGLLTMLTENNYLQARYKQLPPKKSTNWYADTTAASKFANVTIVFK